MPTVISTGAVSNITVDLKALYRSEHILIGCNSTAHPQEDMAASLKVMKPLLESGELHAPDTSAYTRISLSDAAETYAQLMKGTRKRYVILQD
jgi:hypothetical protein